MCVGDRGAPSLLSSFKPTGGMHKLGIPCLINASRLFMTSLRSISYLFVTYIGFNFIPLGHTFLALDLDSTSSLPWVLGFEVIEQC